MPETPIVVEQDGRNERAYGMCFGRLEGHIHSIGLQTDDMCLKTVAAPPLHSEADCDRDFVITAAEGKKHSLVEKIIAVRPPTRN